MIAFARLTRRAADTSLLEQMLSAADKRPAREQLDTGYAHGGGWVPNDGWTLDPKTFAASYPGDPPFEPIAIAKLRDELIVLYPYDFVAIVQPGGAFEIARMT